MRERVAAALLLLLAFPSLAAAHGETRAAAFGEDACGGKALTPTKVVTGSFDTSLAGSYVMVPFDVPAGTTAVRVKYCWDKPDLPIALSNHTIDLGLWDARSGADWGREDFRGWGGSSHPDVTVTPQGFAPGYTPEHRNPELDPDGLGHTTRGFVPGPIEPGAWAVELGLGAVLGLLDGDSDGKVNWRVEIALADDPAYDDVPYVPAPYDESPAKATPGWYKGDFHVHAEHSSLGDATMAETFGFAFRPRAQAGAGLDFITLSDYVTKSGWGEIGRHQADHPGKLVVRSSEVITYKGHVNNHASLAYADHRTGPVYERRDDGSLAQLRGARPVSQVMQTVRDNGGFTQINHPTIFPSAVPGFKMLCRGCPWDHPFEQTNLRLVDAIEVSTGPAGLKNPEVGPNPFTPLALEFYDRALRTGARIAAVGSSDSHNAGRVKDALTQAPIGQATTVVYADELSEEGVRRAVRRRHTYVKLYDSAKPDIRFEAVAKGRESEPPAIMGDVVRATAATFTARVTGADLTYQLYVVKDGLPILPLPVTSGEFAQSFPSLGEGSYRLQLMQGTTVHAVSSPIWLDADAAPEDFGDGLPRGGPTALSLRVRSRIKRLRATCAARGYALRECRFRVRSAGRTIAIGRAPLRGERATATLRLTTAGKALLRRRATLRATMEVRAVGDRGNLGPARRRIVIRR